MCTNRGEPLKAGRGVTSWGSLLVFCLASVSSEWCAAGCVQLLWMELLLLLLLLMMMVVVVVVGSHDRATGNPIAIPTRVLLVIS